MAHLLLFGYAYPTERDRIPASAIARLESAIRSEPSPPKNSAADRSSPERYGTALREWGYTDGRLKPHGPSRLTRSRSFPSRKSLTT
jgi:hypothetical protein